MIASLKTLCRLAAAFAVTLFGAGVASAQAPTGTVTLNNVPAELTNAYTPHSLAVSYTLTAAAGSGINNAKITINVMPGFYVAAIVGPAGVTGTCEYSQIPNAGMICTATLAISDGQGISGQLLLDGTRFSWSTQDGQSAPTVATLTANYNGGSMTPVVDTKYTLFHANAVPYTYLYPSGSEQWLINPNTGEPGLAFEYFIDSQNHGNAAIFDPVISMTFPQPILYLGWRATYNEGWYGTPNAPAQWANGPFSVAMTTDLNGTGSQIAVRLWVPCSALPLTTLSQPVTSGLDGVEHKFTGDVTRSATFQNNQVPTTAATACGAGGGGGKSSNPHNSIGEGENFTFSVSATPPNGVVSVTNAVVVDRLPAKALFVSAAAPVPTQFTRYYCVLPGVSGNFTAADFLTGPAYRTNGCSTTVPGTPGTVTHLVWYAPTWGDSAGITNLSVTYTMNAPLDTFTNNEVLTNTARVQGTFNYNGVSTFDMNATDTIGVKTEALAQLVTMDYTPNPKQLGQVFRVQITNGSDVNAARIRNPVVTFDLPPGISFIPGNTTFDFGVNSGCGWLPGPAPVGVYPTAPVISTLGNGYTRLRWAFGDNANPMRLPFNCFPEGWNNPLIIAFDLRIETNAGILNGQQLTVEHRLGGDNVATPRLRPTIITIAVPAEMRTSVEPDCDDNLKPSLLVNYQNSGGVELTDASVEVAIPKANDNSGTEVDTTFVRTENVPGGATIEYFYTGAWHASLPGNLALVQRVRLVEGAPIPGLAPKRSFNVVLSVPGGTPVGTFIRGSSMMAAEPLGSLASANSAPIKVDMCPGILGVHTFFDTDGNGSFNTGDVNLAGWDFTVTDRFDISTVLDWTTDGAGNYSQQLSPSTYEFEVFAPDPIDPQATWVFTPPPDTVLESDDNTTLPVAVTCICNDDNGCTTDSCRLGVCTFELGGEVPETDTTCDGIDDDCDGTDDDDFVGEAEGCGDGPCAIEGVQVCQNGTVYFSYNGFTYSQCQPNYEAGSNEVCDEQDNDCDGEVDNNLGLGDECTVGYGPCQATGVYVCADQNVECNAVSEVQPETETCDNVDNDCDGDVDNGIAPQYTSCGEGGCFATGAMVCYQGTTVFMANYRGSERLIEVIAFPERCEPNDENRTAESCDNFDNDCDGFVDDGFHVGESCSAGQGQCTSTGTMQCGNGSSFCNAPTIAPGVERCDDQLDSDCDGRNSNGFELIGQPCNATGGAEDADNCVNDRYTCGGTTLACPSFTVATERCDGLDNNCNGQADETYKDNFWKLGQACDGTDGDGCNEGVFVCNGAQNGTICGDNSTTNVELCNGIDDDCDAATDENWKVGNSVGFTGIAGRFLGQTCDGSNDADLCERGNIECSLDFTTVYCHEAGVGLVELCDAGGADEDCDGSVNEGFDIGVACMTDGVGACSVAGTIACDDDNATSTCVPTVPYVPTAEVCNGIDDDCDGGVDNVPQSQTSICKPLETDITTGPPAITAITTATFTYVNPLATPVASHTTFQCSLDGMAWTACNHVGATPTLSYTNLPAGPHTLLVRATRADGTFDLTPDVWTWVIDLSVPETTIVTAPTNPSQNPTGTIVFGSPTPNPGPYSCVLDPAGGTCPAPGAAAYSVCANPYAYTNLAEGPHTICVYVTNTAGTVDPTPATYSWIIDLSAPETEIVAAIPPKATNETTVVFNYIDPTAPATNTFECSLDGSAWVDCDGKTNTYTGLSEGEHTFTVRTIDEHGIVDPTPASYTFVVDLTEPCATVTNRPADPSQSDAALFSFSSSEAGSVFMCSLDGATAAACSAVTSLSGLAEGDHTMVVYALDAAGNASTGQCRVTVAWTIDTRFPETEITVAPTLLVGVAEEVTLVYVDPTDDDLLTFECSLDGAAFTRCDGTIAGEGGTTDYDALPVGTHTFTVRACDLSIVGAPQCDPTPATTSWEVTTSPCPNDRAAPALVCAPDTVLECVDGGATIDLDDMTPAITDACAPVQTTTSASAEVSLGQTPVVFSGTDGNGNRSSCVTMVTVVDVTKPTAVCPADIEVGTDAGVCTAAVAISAATGDDACQGNVGLLHISDAPTAFIPGETVVTHHVIDAAGNEATCQQRVTVVDDEDLTLTCTASATVDAPADACTWTGTRTALATDNCSDELTVDVTGTYPVGVSPVLFTAADAAGNDAECTTELTVRDVTKPVVVCGTPVGTLPTLITATATDACGATVTLQNVVCTKVIDGTNSNVPLVDCPVSVNGASLEVDGRFVDGNLAIAYQARAVDAAGNEQLVDCTYGNAADRDGDGIVDGDDNCVADANTDQRDGDNDGVGDACDVCPTTHDDQADSDADGVGDACQDKDRDGVLDIEDNCPADANAGQEDADDDQLGDVCDPTPYEGITAEGAGGCAGGGVGLFGLLGLAIVFGRRRSA